MSELTSASKRSYRLKRNLLGAAIFGPLLSIGILSGTYTWAMLEMGKVGYSEVDNLTGHTIAAIYALTLTFLALVQFGVFFDRISKSVLTPRPKTGATQAQIAERSTYRKKVKHLFAFFGAVLVASALVTADMIYMFHLVESGPYDGVPAAVTRGKIDGFLLAFTFLMIPLGSTYFRSSSRYASGVKIGARA